MTLPIPQQLLIDALKSTKPFDTIEYLVKQLDSDGLNFGDNLIVLALEKYGYDNNLIPILKLLIENGADINKKSSIKGTSCLQYAVLNKNISAMEFLIANGADIYYKDDEGHDLLYYAERTYENAIFHYVEELFKKDTEKKEKEKLFGKYYFEIANKYFESLDSTKLMKMNDIINNNNNNYPISLDLLDYFIGTYIIEYDLTELVESKNLHLSVMTKQFFDPIIKPRKITFIYVVPNINKPICATIGCLNVFKWCFENDVITYIENHYDHIYEKYKKINYSDTQVNNNNNNNNNSSPKIEIQNGIADVKLPMLDIEKVMQSVQLVKDSALVYCEHLSVTQKSKGINIEKKDEFLDCYVADVKECCSNLDQIVRVVSTYQDFCTNILPNVIGVEKAEIIYKNTSQNKEIYVNDDSDDSWLEEGEDTILENMEQFQNENDNKIINPTDQITKGWGSSTLKEFSDIDWSNIFGCDEIENKTTQNEPNKINEADDIQNSIAMDYVEPTTLPEDNIVFLSNEEIEKELEDDFKNNNIYILEEENKKLENEISCLKDELEDMKNRINYFRDDNTNLQEQLDRADEIYKSLINDNKALHENMITLNKENDKLMNYIDEIQNENVNLYNEKEDLEKMISGYKVKLDMLRKAAGL